MDTPLRLDGPTVEDVQYLTGSRTRLLLLDRLSAGPVDRRDLRDDLDISQPTTSRTLAAFEDRGWVTHEGREFRTTPVGSFLAEVLGTFLEHVETAGRLADMVQWFPEDGFGFDLDRLATAEIVTTDDADVGAPIDQLARELQDASHVVALSHGITRSLLQRQWGPADRQPPAGTWVFDSDVLELLRDDPEMRAAARGAIGSGRMTYYCYDGDVPYNVVVTDQTVNLCLTGGDGAPNAEIQTADESVLAWAEETIAAYRQEATPITADAFDT